MTAPNEFGDAFDERNDLRYMLEEVHAPGKAIVLLEIIARRLESIDDSLGILVDWTELLKKRLPDETR